MNKSLPLFFLLGVVPVYGHSPDALLTTGVVSGIVGLIPASFVAVFVWKASGKVSRFLVTPVTFLGILAFVSVLFFYTGGIALYIFLGG